MQKIFRAYPDHIDFQQGLLHTVAILDFALENEAKASAAHILGEYAEQIPNVIDLISVRIERYSFPPLISLQLPERRQADAAGDHDFGDQDLRQVP